MATLLAGMLVLAGLPASQSARASIQVNLLSSSSWVDTIGYVHIVGEVQNAGSQYVHFVEININEYGTSGNLLGTDFTFTTVDILAPASTYPYLGEKSPFVDTFMPPAGYDHYSIANISANAGPAGNHYFPTTVTNTFVDGVGYEHIVGQVINDNSSSDDFVEPVFTFYDPNGKTVDADFTFINTGSYASLGPGQTASYELIRASNAPHYSSKTWVTQSPNSSSVASPPSCAQPYTSTSPTSPTATGGGTYHPLTPFRILDTRPATQRGPYNTPFGSSTTREVQVGGFPGSGVPASGVSAVVLNVTVTSTTAPSYLTVFPGGAARPLASNLNWSAGVTIPNLVQVSLGPSSTSAPGYISVFNNQGLADVVIDVAGYVGDDASSTGPDGLFNPLSPSRILDTRNGLGALGPHSMLSLTATGTAGGAPSTGTEAVVLNVTVTNPTAPSFLTVWPEGDPQPTASNLNFVAGQTIPNRVIVKVGAGGKVKIFNNAGSVDVIADVGGWYTDTTVGGSGLRFHGVTPYRILDSRLQNQQGPYGLPLCTKWTLPVQVTGTINGGTVPANAQAAVLNVTVTETTGDSFMTVWPDTVGQPLASDLNWAPSVTIPNLVVVKLGDGKVDAFNNVGTTDLVVDVVGFYT